jgi:nitrate reductase NapAB chaperone NapD
MNYGRAVVIVESTDKHLLIEFMKKLFIEWKKLLHLSEEPMMNVLCSYQQELWRFIIFPRRKHRPDVYFKEGNERVLVSPAAVDIGGLIVTPLEKDFLRIDAKLIEEIFVEVSEKQNSIEKILELLQ